MYRNILSEELLMLEVRGDIREAVYILDIEIFDW